MKKRNISILLVLVLCLTLCFGLAIANADTNKPVVSVTTEEVVSAGDNTDANIYKMDFSVQPTVGNGIQSMAVTFSFDKANVIPVNRSGHAEVDSANYDKSLKTVGLYDGEDDECEYQELFAYRSNDSRVAFNYAVFTDKTVVNTAAQTFFSFYYKADQTALTSDSIKIETDASAGSFLDVIYPGEGGKYGITVQLSGDKDNLLRYTTDASTGVILDKFDFPYQEAAETYPVTYDYNYEGAPAATVVNDIVSGSTLTEPEDPQRENYLFGGWFKEEACTDDWVFAGDDADTVNKATTLYAKWTEATYTATVKVNKDGAEWLEDDPPTITLKDNSEDPKSYDNGDSVVNGTYNIFANNVDTGVDITVTGENETVELNYYTVSFKNGEETIASVTVLSGGDAAYLGADPTKEATAEYTFEFDGWVTSDGGTEEAELNNITEKTTVYASFTATKNKYDVTYNYNYEGVTEPYIVQNNIEYGSRLTAPEDPQRENYLFGGWFKEEACTDDWVFAGDDADTVNKATTLYAKWTEATYTATVKVNKDGAEWLEDDPPTITLKDNSEDPKSYDNGDSVVNGTYNIFANDVDTDVNITVNGTTATAELNYYTVSFKNGGKTITSVTVLSGGEAAYQGDNPTKEATAEYTFKFDGWVTSDGGTEKAVLNNITEITTVYASFTATKNKYDVTYNYNFEGVTEPYIVQNNIEYGSRLTAPEDPQRENYLFGGWFKEEACSDDWVFEGDYVDTVSEATTLYAKWTACQHKDYTSNNNGTHTCGDCGAVLNCVDADNDGKCDVCGGEMSKCNDFEVSEIADGQFIITVNGQAIGIENGVVVFTEIAEDADVTALGGAYLWNIVQTENGWTIQNANGQYLAADGNNVVLSETPFDWKYNKGRFYTTVKTKIWFFEIPKNYYLAFDGSMLDLSSRTSRSTVCLYSINPSGAHDYTSVVTEPTCTEQGYTTFTCSKCGDSYQSDFVEALGHDYEDVVTDPTCTEQGYTTHTCTRCDDSYIDGETDALGHDYEEVVTDPTCTEQGYTTYTCTRCGDSYTDNETDALGHVDENEDGICDRCGESMNGSEVIAFANVTKETKIHGWWIFKWTSTTYTANIEVSAENTEVSKVEYSLNNGRSWKTGTEFKTDKDPGNFLIKVTDSNRDVTKWQYDSASGATVEIQG